MMNHQRIGTFARQHTRFLCLLVAVSLLLGMVGPAPVLHAAGSVELDGDVHYSTADGVSSISITSHTTGTGDNRLMLVGVSANSYMNPARTIVSVTFTYDTTELPLTLVGAVENESGRLAAIYKLVDPPSGQEGTVTVTFSGAVNYGIVVGVANFKGVDQTTPLGTFASATGTNTTPSVNVTTTASDLVFDTVFLGSAPPLGTLTVDASQTSQWNTSIDRLVGAASTELATTTTTQMSWTVTGGPASRYWAIGAVPIKAQVTYDLTVTVVGSGTVTSSPAGIDCGSDCTEDYDYDTDVTLSAVADTGWTFTGWSGEGCSGTGTCVVDMTAARSVSATFTEEQYNVSVTVVGSGTVNNNPGNPYTYGQTATLEPVANLVWTFAGWSGPDAGELSDNGDGTWDLTMNGDKAVTATFTQHIYYFPMMFK